ncbi:MAG: carboxypeptidase-like regulatory domain-containing protein, partial [Blastocatellia bacterium]
MRHLIVKSIGLGLLAALFAAFAVRGAAQSDNTQISGFVKDQAGGVIANAKVTVKSDARAFVRSATTNAEGYFVITQLPPGLY